MHFVGLIARCSHCLSRSHCRRVHCGLCLRCSVYIVHPYARVYCPLLYRPCLLTLINLNNSSIILPLPQPVSQFYVHLPDLAFSPLTHSLQPFVVTLHFCSVAHTHTIMTSYAHIIACTPTASLFISRFCHSPGFHLYPDCVPPSACQSQLCLRSGLLQFSCLCPRFPSPWWFSC